mmetsp:Transcript_47180/g.122385  ORF Transcript_47180/g.122385 Transcript_47180/m.122385 type:complete len:276 (+) Transcript_47180:130-957(+)
MSANAFKFVVPDCDVDSTLSVPAPDGMQLKIPLKGSQIQPGDEIYMSKGSSGQWSLQKAVRGAPTPQQGAPAPQPAPQWLSAAEMAAHCSGPGSAAVRLDTTKGPIVVRVAPAWAPRGAQRFLQLVEEGYFTDIAIYRAIRGGLLQFGVVQDGDPRSTRYDRLEDDPLVGVPYAEGVVGFAAAGPGTRKSTICIMKADFRTQLGKGPLGTKSTETPFGMVSPESMGVMHSIACLGDIPQCGGRGPDPGKLEALGNKYIRSEFPECDFVVSAVRLS